METKAMQHKKARMSKIFKCAWHIKRSENLNLSKSLRKSWLLATALEGNYRFTPNMFDPQSVDIVFRNDFVGSVRVLDDGFIQGKNRLQSYQVFRNRHEAIKFALSNLKNKALTQLPLL